MKTLIAYYIGLGIGWLMFHPDSPFNKTKTKT